MKRAVFAAIGLLSANAASAAIITYSAILSGANETPANNSAATGMATVLIDDIANTMSLKVMFAGLEGATTAAHIHCCTAVPFNGNVSVATATPSFPGFPTGVTSGGYERVFDLTAASTYNAAFITANGGVAGAEAALLAGMAAGKSYYNLHTRAFSGGEIRGFFVDVPEPGSFALFGLAAAGLVMVQRRRKMLA